MFLKKFVNPNKKFRSGPSIATVGRSQCVHASGFSLSKTTLGKIHLTLFRYFVCSVNRALFYNTLETRVTALRQFKTEVKI